MHFLLHFPRHEDLKIMLDGSKDGQKLDAMKMIIGVRWLLIIMG